MKPVLNLHRGRKTQAPSNSPLGLPTKELKNEGRGFPKTQRVHDFIVFDLLLLFYVGQQESARLHEDLVWWIFREKN